MDSSDKMLPRAFGKIQVGRRIAIPEYLLNRLGWEIGDQIIVEDYKGFLLVENVSRKTKPISERIK